MITHESHFIHIHRFLSYLTIRSRKILKHLNKSFEIPSNKIEFRKHLHSIDDLVKFRTLRQLTERDEQLLFYLVNLHAECQPTFVNDSLDWLSQ